MRSWLHTGSLGFSLCLLSFAFLTRQEPQFSWRSPGKAGQALWWKNEELQLSGKQFSLHQPRYGYAVASLRDPFRPDGISLLPQAQTLDLNHVLVPLHQLEDLDRLAELAHASTGMCGSIEWLPQALAQVPPPPFQSGLIAGAFALDSARPILEAVSLEFLDRAIARMSALSSRFYRHAEGEQAHLTLKQLWSEQLQSNDWQWQEVEQALSPQKSLILRLPGQGRPEETIILGAHLDSIASRSGNSLQVTSPGADDDASGLGVLTEILRLIESHGLRFQRSLELHAYAAEEVGLVGSRGIAESYAQNQRKIAGMLQFDMTRYSETPNQGIIYLLEDYTSADLRRLAIDLMRQYLGPVFGFGRLPKGSASDHKSFWNFGYATLFPFEHPSFSNPYIHSTGDSLSRFDNGLLATRMAQLGLLFAMHQGGWLEAKDSLLSQKQKVLPSQQQGDLYLAVQGDEKSQTLSVSTPNQVKSLEVCRISSPDSPHCEQDRLVLKLIEERDSRLFFQTQASMKADESYRVMAYDREEKLLAFREFQWQSKSLLR